METKKSNKKINLILTEEVLKGNYSNNVMINFNKTEFILDFGLFQPQTNENKIQSRVIMHPENIKMLIHSLQKTVDLHQKHQKNIYSKTVMDQTVQ